MDYGRYQTLHISRRGPGGTVLDIQMRAANGKLPTAGHDGHRELAQIWRDVSQDDSVRAAVLRGAGLACQGLAGRGDLLGPALGPAAVHALEHVGPVLALGAAGAGMDFEIGVEAVGLARQQRLDLPAGRLLLDAEARHA